MNGPDHYREGDRLLALSEDTPSNFDETSPAATLLVAQATAHFLAAQVAATAMRAFIDGTELGASEDEFRDWYDAIEIGVRDYEGVAFGGTTDPSIVSQQNAENAR
ncbi:hypothetical protein [Streptomyces sp. B21-083]|uniref:hypothetical protein n=1 Tax=Streptomyces sp. B21-083 TaxID=3039410 RepID=UPI002FF3BDA2